MSSTPISRMEALGRAGFVISVCCGPTPTEACAWSVDVLSPATGEAFDRPFAAHTFEHAMDIAEAEVTRRGWLKEKPPQ